MASTIKRFTKGGKAISGVQRSGVTPSPLGVFDPTTGRVYQKPRATLERLTGRSVTITNPKASLNGPRAHMTQSIGMGGKGQVGINRDVGSSTARGEG
jgi:hypothetical protein